MAVEKGQKYKAGNYVFTILSDVFDGADGKYVAYSPNNSDEINISLAAFFEGERYTLVVEPKFKVGDRVLTKKYDGKLNIIGVSSERDYEGDFAYLTKGPSGDIDITFESWIIGKVTD